MVFLVKNNCCCDVCYKNVSVCHTGSRWLRILEQNVETRYLNSSFCIRTLMPFFFHWTYWWGILVSNVRSQTGVLWFLPSPPAPSLPLSLKYILKKDYEWNISWEISTDCYSCQWSSGICHCAWNVSGTSLSSILFTTSKTNAGFHQLVKIW